MKMSQSKLGEKKKKPLFGCLMFHVDTRKRRYSFIKQWTVNRQLRRLKLCCQKKQQCRLLFGSDTVIALRTAACDSWEVIGLDSFQCTLTGSTIELSGDDAYHTKWRSKRKTLFPKFQFRAQLFDILFLSLLFFAWFSTAPPPFWSVWLYVMSAA